MNKYCSVLIFSSVLAASSLHAAVTLTMSVGDLRNSSGAIVANNTTMALVSGTSGFGSLSALSSDLSGVNLQAGTSFGTGFKILAVAGATDLNPTNGDYGYGTSANFALTGLTGGAGTAGTDLAILWFPGLTGTGAQTLSNGQSFGFFRSDTIDSASWGGTVPGSAISFNTPTDGGAYDLAYSDTNLGGGISTGSFTASNTVGAVPEPSRTLFCMIGFVALVGRRRRK